MGEVPPRKMGRRLTPPSQLAPIKAASLINNTSVRAWYHQERAPSTLNQETGAVARAQTRDKHEVATVSMGHFSLQLIFAQVVDTNAVYHIIIT